MCCIKQQRDGIADTIKPRLAKCGGDMTRVRFINEDEKQLSMTDDRIEKAIRQNNVRLMIMDPIQAYLGANVDMNRANEIRPLFRASQYDCRENWMCHCSHWTFE